MAANMEVIMKILALDSSGLVASVAIIEEENMVAEYTIHYKKTHSQTLLPMLDEIVKMVELDLSEIDAIAVAKGPGSFTGLRIGSATAKGIGLALKKPIIPIPTVDGIAYNLYGTNRLICPLMDARRNQVYTGIYTFQQEKLKVIAEQKAVAIEEIVKELNQLSKENLESKEVIFLGDGVDVYKEIINETMQMPYSFAPAHVARQRAGAVGMLAFQYWKERKTEEAKQHQPEYLRLSQAERERLEKMNQV